jgi:bla regulator protein BlaR1
MDRKPKPGTHLPTDERSDSGVKASQRTTEALTQSGTAATTLLSNGSAAAPTLGCVLAGSTPTEPKPELALFHSSGPLQSYEVATIKPLDPNTASGVVRLPPGASLSPLSIRRYIMNAYGALYPPQVAGGPDWLNKDAYVIHGKVPDDLESAFQKMTSEEQTNLIRVMQQCLLADRFHLKAHFETRTLPVYELVPAKGGLKITEVPAPEPKPGAPPPLPRAGGSLAPGSMMTTPNSNGLRVLNGRAIKRQLLSRVIGSEIGDRPIVDHTGFTGYFDIVDLIWAPLGDAAATNQPDAPSLPTALEEKLGLKIVSAKAPIEVLVIDRIERPTSN